MSDYFLNKIYDSLLSKQPIVKTKNTPKLSVQAKTLTESYQLVKEKSKTAVAQDIINVAPELKHGSGKPGEIRLQPIQKASFTEKDIYAALELADLEFQQKIEPKQPGSKSSKFPTYVAKDKDNIIHNIVVGGGSYGNIGMEFERKMVDVLRDNLQNQDSFPFYQQFKKVVGPVNFVKVEEGFSQRVRRQLTGKAENKGQEIADVTLIDDKNQKYFLSLKNIDGSNLANNGLGNMFTIRDGKIITNPSPNIDPLLDAVGMDKNKIADLIEKYRDKIISGEKKGEILTNFNAEVIYNYLQSAIDYGYYYVRETKTENFTIIPILTLEDLKNFIGEIQTVAIQYPYYFGEGRLEKRKEAHIVIQTTKHLFAFKIKNPYGDLLPVRIDLTKLK